MTHRELVQVLQEKKPSFSAVIPKGTIDPERFFRMALVAATKQPTLAQCEIKSVVLALMDAAALGLDPSGLLGQAAIVPFFDSKRGVHRAQLIIGYRGYIALAMKDGLVIDIQAHCVYKDDHFVIEYGTNPHLEHVPNYSVPQEDDNIIGAYAVAWLKTGRVHFHFVPRARIEQIKARVKPSGLSPWITDFPEMCKKTAIRALMKLMYIPIESATGKAVAMEESFEYSEEPINIVDETPALPVEPERKTDRLAKHLKKRQKEEETPQEEIPPPANEDVPLEDIPTVHAKPGPGLFEGGGQ